MPDVTSCTDHIHSWQNLIHILEHSKERSHGLTGWGHCFKLLFLWQCCDTIPCSVFFFFIWKGWNQLQSNTWNVFFTDVCALQSANKKPREHKYSSIWNFPPLLRLHSPPFQLSCHFPDCYTLILSDKHFNFFLWFSPQRQFGSKHYKTDYWCHCSCL